MAGQYDISPSTVTSLLEKRSVKRRQRGLSEAELATAMELYGAGRSLTEIGRELGYHPGSIQYALAHAGVQMRRPHKLTDEEIVECVRLYGEGWSTVRLGRRFGLGDRTVAKALREAGVPLRRPGPQRA